MTSYQLALFYCVAILGCCLVSSLEKSVRITNGQEGDISLVPYVVQLRDERDDAFCGGSLVSPIHVVTAAHCVVGRPMNTIKVVAGVSGRSDVGQSSDAIAIFIHPEYTRMTMHSDVAVVKLRNPLSGENIRTIRLNREPLRENDTVVASGWGRLSYEVGSPEKLQVVRIPVRSPEDCLAEFSFAVEKNMFCASGREAKGICFGDSGGPAVYRGELAGISAMAYRCGQTGYQSAFTDIYSVTPFILNAMRK